MTNAENAETARAAEWGLVACEVEIFDMFTGLTGYVEGEHWNGFLRPWFDRENADSLCAQYLEYYPTGRAAYDPARDAVVMWNEEIGEAPEGEDPADYEDVWPGEDVLCADGQTRRLYPIGAGSWVWTPSDRYKEDPSDPGDEEDEPGA